MRFIRPTANWVYNCHKAKGIKLITRLCLNVSHLPSHKFKHDFQDSLNSLWACGLHEEPTSHFLLHCPSFATERSAFLSTTGEIDSDLLNCIDSVLMHTLLFGKSPFDTITNTPVLGATIDFILSTKRFREPFV